MDSQPTQACWCRLIYGILVKDVTKLNTWLQQTQREEKVEDENDQSATKRPADETADDIDAEINLGRSNRQDTAKTLLSTDKGLKQDQGLK